MAKLWVILCLSQFESMITRMNSIKSIAGLWVSYRELSVRAFVKQWEDAPLNIADSLFLT